MIYIISDEIFVGRGGGGLTWIREKTLRQELYIFFSKAVAKPADNTDECSNSPCKNGAACVNRYNDYLCMCPGGFTGKNCDTGEQPLIYSLGKGR